MERKRWIISDTHFGHESLQAHDRRPPNVDTMIINNWKKRVGKDDIVIHLGDVAFTFVDLKGLMDSLPGTKWLTLGNHDGHTVTWYMNNGFQFVADAFQLGSVYFTHKPVAKLPSGATVNVHGHLHNRVPRDYKVFPHSKLFALEHCGYSPQRLDKFLNGRACQGGVILPTNNREEETFK